MVDSTGARPDSQTKSRKRLLVVTYHYPPDGAVGGLRWSGLSKYLAGNDWEIHIITAAAQNGASPVPGVHVHYCPKRQTLNDIYVRAARCVRGSDSAATTASKRTDADAGGNARALGLLRREIAALLDLPDFARGWIVRSARRARALLAQGGFNAVVTSGPPHAAHLAGVLATLGRPEPLIADFRDPWADQLLHGRARTDVSLMHRLVIPRLEQFVLRRAARIVTNTQEFAERLRAAGKGYAVHFLPNGIDRQRLPGPAEKLFGGVSIAHVGTLYLGRDFSPVFKAMDLFCRRHSNARAQLRLRVAGVLDGHRAQLTQEQMAALGLSDLVELLGLVPNDQALGLLNRSHLALVLAQNQPLQIPAKLYECLGLHVPTLVIAESDSAAARESRRLGAFTCESNDIEGICQVIEQVWRDAGVRRSPKASIEYEHLADEMHNILQEVLSELPGAASNRESSLTDLAGQRSGR